MGAFSLPYSVDSHTSKTSYKYVWMQVRLYTTRSCFPHDAGETNRRQNYSRTD